ncbi:MAG: hypothetical protein CME36_09805 [unclassified Hahellaceae]|nr:hypothetical protein [Hahellaceae bacterium]|tara:strand:- start:17845 stop:18342 length:498 start_codon:yes stop_codon:yes gene_type:complete
MVEVETSGFPGCARLTLSPNNALGWHNNVRIIACLSVVSLMTALYLFSLGATLVLLFTVAELSLFTYLTYRICRRCASREIIELSENAVTLERGYRRLEFRCSMERMATRIEVERDRWKNLQLFLVCRQVRVPIGAELNEADREHLLKQLRALVESYQNRFAILS